MELIEFKNRVYYDRGYVVNLLMLLPQKKCNMKKILSFLFLGFILISISSCEGMFGAFVDKDEDEDETSTSIRVYNPYPDLEFIEAGAFGDSSTGRVHFEFVVENKDYDLRYYFGYATAYTDEAKTHEAGYVGWVDLPKRTPVTVSYSGDYCHFSRVSDTATKFKTIKIYIQSDGGNSEELKFTNVPIYWD